MKNWKISTLSENYFKRNILPILWEILCLAGFVLFPAWLSYSNAAFYIGLIIYFRKDIDLHEMWKHSAEHSLHWLGILETACIAIPFTAAYIKTKNIHVVITAHAILNLIGNLPTVIAAVGNRMA